MNISKLNIINMKEEKTSNSVILPQIEKDTRPFIQCLIEFLDSTGGRDKVNIN